MSYEKIYMLGKAKWSYSETKFLSNLNCNGKIIGEMHTMQISQVVLTVQYMASQNMVSIGLDNGLLPFQHQALFWTIVGLLLTHWGRDKMAAIFQMTFSNAFSWMKMY